MFCLFMSIEWGRIINISSVHGLVGNAGKVGYSAAKHGLMGLTKVRVKTYVTIPIIKQNCDDSIKILILNVVFIYQAMRIINVML